VKILVTGAAGFIGAFTSKKLVEMGHEVIGVDNLNDYYDVALKHGRLGWLEPLSGFQFKQLELADRDAVAAGKRLLQRGDDAHSKAPALVAAAHQRLPQVTGGGEHVDHAVKRRAGGLRQRDYQHFDEIFSVFFHINSQLVA